MRVLFATLTRAAILTQMKGRFLIILREEKMHYSAVGKNPLNSNHGFALHVIFVGMGCAHK